jgi:hypothetical protein
MPNALDLFVIPLYRRDSADQAYLPGVHILAAPKRAARGRAGERLILQLTLPAEINLSADQQHNLLSELAEGYFRSAGAVTSALREQIERLNAYFLQLNQKGNPAAARLSAISVREDRATLAQCGPLQAFLLNGEIEHFYDPQGAGRGLGLSNNTEMRFYQMELKPGAVLLLVPDLPSGWSEKTLSNVSGQKLSTLRRRFLSEAGPNLQSVMIVAQPGEGRLSLMTSFDSEAPAPKPAEVVAPASTKTQAPAWEAVEVPEPSEGEVSQPAATTSPEPAPMPSAFKPRDPDPEPSAFSEIWASISAQGAKILGRTSPFVRKALVRLLPEDPMFNLPRQTMAIIAIVMPLLVVVLVSVVYLQFGRGQLYSSYLAQAQSAAAAAEAREDPAEVRQAWGVAVYYAQRAVQYQEEDETAQQLLVQAQLALDDLDAIVRVDFQPALFENLPSATNITRMAATNTDLYMLNSTDGSIIRAFLTGGGYQIDEDFHCEPGPYGSYIVSPLIDLALLPRGNELDANLVAMDANGNLIYCIVGERPLAVSLIPPDISWGEPNAIAVENDNLYVLDPLTNAVWIYFGDEQSYVGAPRFFFGAQVPSMQHMLDMSLDGETVYLLDLDGHLAVCDFSDDLEDPTTCTDPAPLTDTRPGRQSGNTISDANFLQLQLTDPPEPSVYLFDPVVPAVYQFSNRLNLVRQFRAAAALPEGLSSAFAVSSNRAIFLAFENEIYVGYIP